MACFVAWYGKKRTRLEKLEREFVDALRSGADEVRLAEAAQIIRIAHIRALKEKRQSIAPSEKNAAIYGKIAQAIRWWSCISVDAIVEGYRKPRQLPLIPAAVRRGAK